MGSCPTCHDACGAMMRVAPLLALAVEQGPGLDPDVAFCQTPVEKDSMAPWLVLLVFTVMLVAFAHSADGKRYHQTAYVALPRARLSLAPLLAE